MKSGLSHFRRFGRPTSFLRGSTLSCLLLLLLPIGSVAAESSPVVARAEHIYEAKRQAYELQRTNAEAAVAFARACFEWAELVQHDSGRSTGLGKEGSAAARRAIAVQGTNAAAHYYLALNLGEIARTKRMSGLKLVAEMEVEFEVACDLDPKIDYGGPDRCLGMLYRDAPGWPVSVGNRNKARQHFIRMVDLAPDFPENQLTMIETHLEWGEYARAERDVGLLDQSWSAAKSKFTGPEWESSWMDWNSRLKDIQKKLSEQHKAPWRK